MTDGKRRVPGSDVFDRPAELAVNAGPGKLILVAPTPGTFQIEVEELPFLHHVLDDVATAALRQKGDGR